MDKITVPFITGDGVGVEITPSMQAIVNAAVQKHIVDNGKLNGWKCGQANGLLKNVACGCLMKRWKLSVITR